MIFWPEKAGEIDIQNPHLFLICRWKKGLSSQKKIPLKISAKRLVFSQNFSFRNSEFIKFRNILLFSMSSRTLPTSWMSPTTYQPPLSPAPFQLIDVEPLYIMKRLLISGASHQVWHIEYSKRLTLLSLLTTPMCLSFCSQIAVYNVILLEFSIRGKVVDTHKYCSKETGTLDIELNSGHLIRWLTFLLNLASFWIFFNFPLFPMENEKFWHP